MAEVNETRSYSGANVSGRSDVMRSMANAAGELSDDDDDDDDFDDDESAHTYQSKRSKGSRSSVKRRKTAAGADASDDTDTDTKLLEAKEYKARLFRRNMILEVALHMCPARFFYGCALTPHNSACACTLTGRAQGVSAGRGVSQTDHDRHVQGRGPTRGDGAVREHAAQPGHAPGTHYSRSSHVPAHRTNPAPTPHRPAWPAWTFERPHAHPRRRQAFQPRAPEKTAFKVRAYTAPYITPV